jgi:signal recognition particle GTPase
MTKLNIAYIIENDEDLFKLSFQSINKADNIIIIDGRQDNSKNLYENLTKVKVIYSKYPHDEKGANGKQRNYGVV